MTISSNHLFTSPSRKDQTHHLKILHSTSFDFGISTKIFVLYHVSYYQTNISASSTYRKDDNDKLGVGLGLHESLPCAVLESGLNAGKSLLLNIEATTVIAIDDDRLLILDGAVCISA